MWRGSNMGVAAVVVLGIMVVGAPCLAVAAPGAQRHSVGRILAEESAAARQPLNGGGAGGVELTAPMVDWNNGRQAVRLIKQWLAKGKVSTKGLSPMPVTGLIGIRITLRSSGATAGWGDAYRPDLDSLVGRRGPAVDMLPLLAQAAKAAFASVRQHLRDAQLHAVLSGIKKHVKVPKLKDIAGQLLVGVQLGHDLQTIKLGTGDKTAALFHQFSPDYDGLRMTPGSQAPASGNAGQAKAASYIWPATAQSRNFSPKSQIVQLLTAQGFGLTALKDVAHSHGPALQRFSVVHVVQPALILPVMHLVRGNVLLPPHSITGATLNDIADRLAGALRNRFLPIKQVVRGTYHPSTQQFDPSVAGPRETALACYALTRRADHLLALNKYDLAGRRLADTALHMLLPAVSFAGGKTPKPAAAALGLLTMCDSPSTNVNKDARDHLGRWLMGLADGHGGFHAAGKNQQALGDAAQALITASLAAWYEHTREAKVGKVVTDSLNALWAKMEQTPDVAALPWLAMAQIRVTKLLLAAHGGGKDAGGSGGPGVPAAVVARRGEIGKLVDELMGRQIIVAPSAGPADVIGGYQLAALPTGAPPTPDWRTADVLSLIAVALRPKAITQGHDELGWLLSAGLAARFVGQLMIDEPSCWYIQDKQQAMGCVRTALWDNQLPISPTAMSLLAVTQLQQTVSPNGGAGTPGGGG